MNTATREEWFQHCERRYAEESIDGLGLVRIRSITYAEAAASLERSMTRDEEGNVQHDSRYVFADRAIATVVDENDEPMFGDMHREKLATMDQGIVAPLHEFIMEHCGLGKYRVSFSDLKKTSEPTTTSSTN